MHSIQDYSMGTNNPDKKFKTTGSLSSNSLRLTDSPVGVGRLKSGAFSLTFKREFSAIPLSTNLRGTSSDELVKDAERLKLCCRDEMTLRNE